MTNELKAKFAEYDKEYALTCAQDFIKYTNQDIKDITRRFFIIGFRLNEAKEQGYVETLGYPDIETLAEKEFEFKRSTTYGLISVFRRFAKRTDNYTYLNQIKDPYKDYTYSQILEINKLVYLPSGDYIKTVIPPSSSVRDVAAYVKFRKEKAGNESYTLPQWKDLPKNAAAPEIEPAPAQTMANAQLEGQLSLEDVTEESTIETSTATENDPKTESEEETPEMTAPVQTFGLLTCAEPEEKPKYNFSTRTGVRAFLNDCLHWKEKECYSPFIGCHYYTLKNKRRIYVYVQRTASKNSIDGIYEVIHRFFIDLNQYSNVPVEITKEQFEKYCAEHTDEL